MKPEQLMIGDYILFNKNIYKIEEISKKGWAHITYNLIDGRECRVGLASDYILDELTPVPLTAEILEKNGFKFYCTDVFEEWKSKDKRITMHDKEYPNSFNKWSVHIDTEDMRTMGYFEITYVHELQHALRLCGINKEIEI